MKYDLNIRFELMPTEMNVAIDKDGKATVIVRADWEELMFDEIDIPQTGIPEKYRELFPPVAVIDAHSEMCTEIIERMGNSDRIEFYTSAETDENGHRSWSTSLREFDYRMMLIRIQGLSLLISVDSGADSRPTRQALTRLRQVVAEAKARYDERVEAWLMIESMLERKG